MCVQTDKFLPNHFAWWRSHSYPDTGSDSPPDGSRGKGYRQKLVAAIYCERIYPLIAKREGGIGSFDESISSGLLSGWPFIGLDNLRGRLASQFLESLLTAPEAVSVRVPYHGNVVVDAMRCD